MTDLSWKSPKTCVRESAIQGRGLFAAEPILAGEIVAIKGGSIFGREELAGATARLGPAEIQVADGFFIGPLRSEDREGSMIFSNHCATRTSGSRGRSCSSHCATSETARS